MSIPIPSFLLPPFSFSVPHTRISEISISFPVLSFLFPPFYFFFSSHIHVNQKFPCLSLFFPFSFHLSIFQFPYTREPEIPMSFPVLSFLFPPFSFSVPIYTWIRNSHVFPYSFLYLSTFLFFSSHIHVNKKFPCLSLFIPLSFKLFNCCSPFPSML